MDTEKLEVFVGFGTDKGQARDLNEDSFCVFTPYPGSENESEFQAVLGVADGMGGHQAGDFASRFVSEKINAAFVKGRYAEKYGGVPDFSLILKGIVRDINLELYTLSKKDPSRGGMGSTLTFGIVRSGVLYVAHVGDSRCYKVRREGIEQLTKDHSWVADQVRYGVLSKEEAAGHPRDNVITQAIGIDPNVEPQAIAAEIAAGDRYIFCTDGLTKHVSDPEILRAVRENSHPQRACDSLIELANRRGGEDNITVVLGYIDRRLPITRELEIPVSPEGPEPGASGFSVAKPVIAVAACLFLLAGGFLAGSLSQRHVQAKRIHELLVQGQTYFQGGEYDKAALVAQSILKIEKQHRPALELMEKIKSQKKGGRNE